MKKYALLFIPMLFVLACKKDSAVTEEVNPFINVIKTSYNNTPETQMKNFPEVAYVGSLTRYGGSHSFLDPLVGAELINSEMTMRTIDGTAIKSEALETANLSNYLTAYNSFVNNSTQVFTPGISYAIYSPDSLATKTKTKVTLVLKSTYFHLDINTIKDENIKLYNEFQLAQAKSSGAYLSNIGFGLSYTTEIISDTNPKLLIPALEAYLDDQINNKGLKSAELKKNIILYETFNFSFLGGKLDDWKAVAENPKLEMIELIIKNLYVPKPQSAFSMVGFEFKSLKDGKIVK
ncbi:hypothetical protein OQX61_07570 [Pedobacter sp. PLR]|uniref:hypothetical protein n=1 Tax=Pedobacter sp. PLR TaxID=2994465 RepID=UPI002246258F|nr:hypothetical protein [Pedobacter sp. PLR]MCX2451126.1 hypothetical protein [Pedobacter sp. PLR]